MNEKHTTRQSRQELGDRRTYWKRVDALTDHGIAAAVQDHSDAAPVADDSFWGEAELVVPDKERLTMRLDREILDYFGKEGRGQTRINAVLRACVGRKRA